MSERDNDRCEFCGFSRWSDRHRFTNEPGFHYFQEPEIKKASSGIKIKFKSPQDFRGGVPTEVWEYIEQLHAALKDKN